SSALFIPHLSSLPFLLFAPLFSSFFSLSRPPPTSSLFPYTTLFRSVPRGRGPAADRLQPTAAPELLSRFGHRLVACGGTRDHPRSEEHTSELQSRFDLVCRLLLEKKNSNNTNRSVHE